MTATAVQLPALLVDHGTDSTLTHKRGDIEAVRVFVLDDSISPMLVAMDEREAVVKGDVLTIAGKRAAIIRAARAHVNGGVRWWIAGRDAAQGCG